MAALDTTTLDACFGAAPDPIAIVDRDGRCVYANARADARLLRRADPRLDDARARVIAGGAPCTVDLDGEGERWHQHALSPVRDASGAIVAVAIVTREVTDRRRAEAALAASARATQRLLDGAPAMVAIMRGPDHVYELVNARFCAAIPEAARLVGTSARKHRADLVEQQFLELLDHVYTTGEPYEASEVPLSVPRKDGRPGTETVFLTFVYQPMRDEAGAIDGIASFAFDVTESVLARKQVEEGSRAKDEFLSTLSHELRTPLNAIVGWSHLLRTHALDALQGQRALEAIDRNARVQKRLIDDLLDFARMVSGDLALQVSPVDLVSIVSSAVDAARPSVGAKNVALTLDVADRPVISGDADRLQQVVWNLLSNALKFTGPRGRIAIEVRTAGGDAEIVVRDDGLGIDQHFLPHVFDRFRQADRGSARRHGGLGLGLAMARSIVELHGGTIEAASEGLGRGATIRVRLPMREEDARDPAVLAKKAALPGAIAQLRGVRVLVVDDEDDARELVDTVLRQRGARVHVASCASDALDALHADEFDVLVSDIGMPEQDGISLIQRVRALPAPTSRIPAIAVTAYARGEDRERAFGAGYDAFVTKPVEVDELGAIVAHVVGRV